MSTDQAHIVKSLAMEVVRELVEDDQFIRTYVREHLRLLTLEDLQAVTGFGEKKIRQLRDEGYLPMFRMPESNEWRITREPKPRNQMSNETPKPRDADNPQGSSAVERLVMQNCPFCGHSPEDSPEITRFAPLSGGMVRARCPRCTALGPVGRDQEDAVIEWNRRSA